MLRINTITYQNNISKTNRIQSAEQKSKTLSLHRQDNITFTGYNQIIKDAAKFEIKNDNELNLLFNELFTKISNSKDIVKIPEFDFIAELYQKYGFKGMLQEFWKSDSQTQIKNILKFTKKDNLILATKNGEPVFQLENYGKQGFFEYLTDSDKGTNNVKWTFLSSNKTPSLISFSIGPKGNFESEQFVHGISKFTKFHLSSGNRQKVVRQCYEGAPNTTYYNKDGSYAFFKSLFLGGTP